MDFFLQSYYRNPGSTIETAEGREELRQLAEKRSQARKTGKKARRRLQTEGEEWNVNTEGWDKPTPYATGVVGDKKEKALARTLAVSQALSVYGVVRYVPTNFKDSAWEVAPLGNNTYPEKIFEPGAPMRNYFDVSSNTRSKFCLCREKEGHEDWVWCDNDERGGCFGFRFYHVQCLHPSLQPAGGKFGDDDEFVCEACLREAQRAKARAAGQDTTQTKARGKGKGQGSGRGGPV